MSAGYDIYIGPAWSTDENGIHVEIDEEGRPPLDRAIVEQWMAELPGARPDGDGLLFDYPGLWVSITAEADQDDEVRVIWVEVNATDEPSLIEDLRDLLTRLTDVAERLGADVHADDNARTITKADIERELAELDGS